MDLDRAVTAARRRYAEHAADRAATGPTGPAPSNPAATRGRSFTSTRSRSALRLLPAGHCTTSTGIGTSTFSATTPPGSWATLPALCSMPPAARWTTGGHWASVHEDEVRLAELLVERFDSIEQIRFTNSGTEANLMALSAAVHHTGRRKILVFANGYHGGVITFGATPNPVNVPHDWHVCRYNDIDDVTAAFDATTGPRSPPSSSNRCRARAAASPAIRRSSHRCARSCDEHGSLLVFDEVMTSRFARGGAQQLLGIRPDLTTLGKYLAGGFTFGAFGGRADVMAHFDPAAGGVLGHAGTFNNNVVSMAAGVATLTEVLTDEVLAATHQRGERLRAALNDTFTRNGLPMCATGSGFVDEHPRHNRARCESGRRPRRAPTTA